MNEVSAICPVCETTAVLAADAMVLVADDFEDTSLGGWAMWACETCSDWSAVAVGRREFAALEALGGRLNGVGHDAWPPQTPENPVQPEQRPADHELTLDDLIEFHRLLEQPDWFGQLLRYADAGGEAD